MWLLFFATIVIRYCNIVVGAVLLGAPYSSSARLKYLDVDIDDAAEL